MNKISHKLNTSQTFKDQKGIGDKMIIPSIINTLDCDNINIITIT